MVLTKINPYPRYLNLMQPQMIHDQNRKGPKQKMTKIENDQNRKQFKIQNNEFDAAKHSLVLPGDWLTDAYNIRATYIADMKFSKMPRVKAKNTFQAENLVILYPAKYWAFSISFLLVPIQLQGSECIIS